ncbi:N-acetylmuramoyl-L-alanine amidase LytC precursor [Microbacterium terrae]|uniref:N-acetylmuramoyl-L-alanine amidase LytC n=2 Tax=Microbacterium terrae TaxID=69369 RepID=A0A0M2HBZ2_9MICO|nr:N-acetylmuramoyl-L-alanine amidase LytC precursor [Microbacterium terrae]
MRAGALLLAVAMLVSMTDTAADAAVPDPTPSATADAPIETADAPDEGATPEPTQGVGVVPSPAVSPTASVSPTPSVSPTASATPTPHPPTVTPSPTPTPTPTEAPIPDGDDEETNADSGIGARALAVAPALPAAGRLSGSDRFGTAIAVSRGGFPSGADTVVVASGYAAVDGVLAAALAARKAAPVLYTKQSSVTAATLTEIERLGPTTILVVDTGGSVSTTALANLRSTGASVVRYPSGSATAISQTILVEDGATFDTVYLAGVAGTADGPIAISAAAGTRSGALIVDGKVSAVHSTTVRALREVEARRIVILGGSTVSSGYEASLKSAGFTVERRRASSAHSLSAAVAAETKGVKRAIVTNPVATNDTAVAAALAAVNRQPLFYSIQPCVPDDVRSAIARTGATVTAVGGTASIGGSVLSNTSCTTEKANRERSLRAAISTTMSKYAGSFTVTVRELGGLSLVASVGGTSAREPASMMKLYAAWAALKRVDQGRASLDTKLASGMTVRTCIHVMIHVSDNYCHTDLVHWIGIPTLNSMIRSAGFTGSRYGSVPKGTSVLYAGNRATTNDLSRFVGMLEKGQLLSAASTERLLGLMELQIWRSRIASGIPPGVNQASKPGALWIASGLTQSDTAVVYGPTSTYAISIIGLDGPSRAALRAISRTVYEKLNGSFGAAASYPVQQMVTTKSTSVRSSPGGATVSTARSGTPIEVIDAVRDWYLVRWGSSERYIHLSALRNR